MRVANRTSDKSASFFFDNQEIAAKLGVDGESKKLYLSRQTIKHSNKWTILITYKLALAADIFPIKIVKSNFNMRITDNQQPLSYIREFRVNVLKNTIAIDDKQSMVFKCESHDLDVLIDGATDNTDKNSANVSLLLDSAE